MFAAAADAGEDGILEPDAGTGRPRIEYICPYGHGTLKEAEVTISGRENSEWTPHSDDLWEALCASGKDLDRR